MTRVAFGIATPDDVAAVVALVQSAYRGEESRAGWTTEADLLDGIRTDGPAVAAIVADPASEVLLAHRSDDPTGPVACCQLRDEGEGRAYFGMFAVRPGAQGGGIGRALLGEAERRVQARWGSTEMRMTVIEQRIDLIAWYARLGYTPTGEGEPFPYGDDRFGIPRRPDLRFVVLARRLGRPAPTPG